MGSVAELVTMFETCGVVGSVAELVTGSETSAVLCQDMVIIICDLNQFPCCSVSMLTSHIMYMPHCLR